MKICTLLLTSLLLFFSGSILRAQPSSGYDPSKDPRVYMRPYYDRLHIRVDEDETDCDQSNFLRWLDRWYGRMKPDGTPVNHVYAKEFLEGKTPGKTARTTGAAPAWQSLGPSFSSGGIGRIECIAFHPTDTNIIFAGAPAGGLWVTRNGGATWTTNTDAIASVGIDDIAVDPVSPNIIYACTGDRDLWDCQSVGVIKSTDTGNTWHTTGLTFTHAQNYQLVHVLIDPAATNVLYAAQKDGTIGHVYKSTDAGATWSIVFSTSHEIYDFKMHPTNGHQIYLSTIKGAVYRTSDAGATWTDITSNVNFVDTSLHEAVTMAVTPAAPNSLYLMAEGNPTPTDLNCGIYVSTDTGNSFTKMADNSLPTIVAWWGYTLGVSPANANLLYGGGSWAYQSNDAGATYITTAGVHVDIHDIHLRGANEAFIGCDGGIYQCTNLSGPTWTWNDISGNMAISEIYGFSSAATSPNLFSMGMQDNGAGLVRADKMYNWKTGGDGEQTAIDPVDSNIIYTCSQNGDFFKSTDGGATFGTLINPIITGESAAWTAPLIVSPKYHTVLWTGFQNVWKSTDTGVTWRKLSNFPPNFTGAPIKHVYAAPTDTNIIYCSFEWQSGFWRTMNNGANWTAVPYPYWSMDNFIVDSANPYHIFATAIAADAGEKVFESVDTGNTWTNISYNMPNILADAVIYENRPPHRLFVGTDMGIYYKHGYDTTWTLFGTGLPNADVKQMEIHNLTNTLRAGTFGRGLWQCTLDTTAVHVHGVSVANVSNPDNIINVYPNPAKNNITVTATNGISKLAISDITGRQVLMAQCNNNEVTVDISGFTPGFYFIKVNDLQVVKLVKE